MSVQVLQDRFGFKDDRPVTAVCCVACGRWLSVDDVTIADLKAGQITVPLHGTGDDVCIGGGATVAD